MNIEIKDAGQSTIEIYFSVPETEINPYYDEALKKLAGQLKINGFRAGKVPPEIAKSYLNETAILEEAADLLIKDIYPKTIIDKKIDVLGWPEVTILKLAPKNPLEFKVKVGVMPQIIIKEDYFKLAQKIKSESKLKETTDQEIDEILEWLQKNNAQLKQVDRPAKIGDAVIIDFETKINNISVENGQATDYLFVLGKGNFLPGFQEKIIGEKAGSIKDFQLQAPLDWPHPNLKGKLVDIKIRLKSVNEQILPPLNDELIRKNTKFKDLNELKENIQLTLNQEKAKEQKEKSRLKFLDELIEKTPFDLPPNIIRYECDKMILELEDSLKNAGIKMDDYLNQIQKAKSDLINDFAEMAIRRLKSAILLKIIAQKGKIEVKPEEIQQKKEELMRSLEPEEKNKQLDESEMEEYIKGIIRNEKVFQLLNL